MAQENGSGSAHAVGPHQQPPHLEDLKEIFPEDVAGMLKLCISMLFGTAWQFMGMSVHPRKGTVVKDLAQARLAIDCGAYLLEQISSRLPEAESREFHRVLQDLRMNFVSHSPPPP